MEIGLLEEFGFTRAAVANWKERGMAGLMPLQEHAVRRTGLLEGRNLALFAPTSSGKTFVAELAAVRRIEEGRKSVFLVPTRALAEEQYARLCRVYERLGLRVAVATRERTAHDAAILSGRYDFAVMVYEKLKSFLSQRPAMVRDIGLVAVDELQLLGDAERGATVDLLLTGLARATPRPQLLCLSAVLAENTRLAAWLDSELCVWRHRPVELREGVLLVPDGIFAYREFNSGREDAEQLLPPSDADGQRWSAEDRLRAVAAVAQELARRGEQLLVFVPTRHMSREWAFHLAGVLDLPDCGSAAEELACDEPSHSRSLLEQCMEHGTAFHNADLPAGTRAAVEAAFRSGSLGVLVATATLAQGVNLSGRNVISEPTMVAGGNAPGAAGMGALSRAMFRNQGGRAGRFRQGAAEFGRSMLLAGSEEEARRLMFEYVFRDIDELDAPIRAHALPRAALDLVNTAGARTADELCDLLLQTYTGMSHWAADLPGLRSAVDSALGGLASLRLVRRARGVFSPTRLGRAAAAYGITPETASLFAAAAGSWADMHFHPFAALAACAFSPDGAAFALDATRGELAVHRYEALLSARDDLGETLGTVPLNALPEPGSGLPEAAHAALKKAFLAEAWVAGDATQDIEDQFAVFAGTVANLGAHMGWLCQALGACAAAVGAPQALRAALAELAERLPDGVPPCGLELVRLNVPGLSRGHIAALVREGYGTREAMLSAEASYLERIVPSALAARIVRAAQAVTQKRRYRQSDLFEPSEDG